MATHTSDYPMVPLVGYSEVRASIESGDLLLCSGTSIFARLIQHATGSVWSHVGCLLRLDVIDRILVLESVESIGVRAVPLSRYVDNYSGDGHGYKGRIFVARHASFTKETVPAFTAFSQRAVDLLGFAYDPQTILHIAARVVAAKVGFHPPAIGQNTSYICSEYCWEIYKAFGITVPYGHGGWIAPHDWAEAPEISVLWEIEVQHAPC